MRPDYHFTPRKNWLSDPNGLVHDGAEWHLFYQYNPLGEDWGNMSWGHATSPDLAHWTEHEIALRANDNRMVFSGSAVIDDRNTAGFGFDAKVAVFTAALGGGVQRQVQSLAYSNDGHSWSEFDGNPVLDLGLADFRDPYVFRHARSESWVMVVVKSDEHIAQIYRSPDLKRWTLSSQIDASDAPGRVWECPTLVEIPVAGTDRMTWFFKVDALHDAPGAGALYLTGDFDGYRFLADDSGWRILDHGRDFYAAIAWNGPRDQFGRPVWIGWMGNHSYQHEFPERGWRGVMSAPRRLSAREKDGRVVLAQEVEPSIAALFTAFSPLDAAEPLVPLACRIRIAPDHSASITISDGHGSLFTIAPREDRWEFLRSNADLPFLDCQAEIERQQDVGLDLWIDTETIEVLSTHGIQSASFQHRPSGNGLAISTVDPNSLLVAHPA